jgi:hypothetical protein
VTVEEAIEALAAAKRKAHAAARKLTMGSINHTPIITAARLDMMETLLIGLISRESCYAGSHELKALLEYRDYWEALAEEIAK